MVLFLTIVGKMTTVLVDEKESLSEMLDIKCILC